MRTRSMPPSKSQERRFQAVSVEVDGRGKDLDLDCRRPCRKRSGAGLRGRYGESESAVCGNRIWRVLSPSTAEQHWVRLKGGLPTIAVRDMAIHPREGDLVIATFGRGFYVLDNITPLRQMKPDSLSRLRPVSGEGCADVYRAASAGRPEQGISRETHSSRRRIRPTAPFSPRI